MSALNVDGRTASNPGRDEAHIALCDAGYRIQFAMRKCNLNKTLGTGIAEFYTGPKGVVVMFTGDSTAAPVILADWPLGVHWKDALIAISKLTVSQEVKAEYPTRMIDQIKKRAKQLCDDNMTNPTPQDYLYTESAVLLGALIATGEANDEEIEKCINLK